MRKCLLTLSLLSIIFVAQSQSNFIKGIVINNNGDSIYGNIDYRNWKNNPQTINFVNAANEKQAFTAYSIKGFYIPSANEIYASFTVEMDMLPGDQDDAIKNTFIDSATISKKVFLLQLLLHPTLRLYQFTDSYKEHFYCIKKNDEPFELIHHYLYDESSKQVKENVTYKEQLFNLFETCPAVANKSKKTKFEKREIQQAFLQYLQCTYPGSVINIKKKDSVSFKFGIVAGLQLTKFKFEGTNSLLVDENYSSNLSPVVGVSVDIALSHNRHKWHIVNEIIYKSYKTSSSFTRLYGNGYSLANKVDLHFSYLQLNTMLRYVFQSTTFTKPYINLGIGNALIVSENKNNLHTVYSFGREENVKAFDMPNRYEFSQLGGTGLMFGNTRIELRYVRSKKSFSPEYTLDVNPTSFQFLFNYQF